MNNVSKLFFSILIFVLSIPMKAASLAITPVVPDSPSLQWHDAAGLPKGAKVATLAGNPKKKEFYVARLKLPANYTVPAHKHLTNEYNTVISGTYYMGIGGSMSKEHIHILPAGSFIAFPAHAAHYGFTK